MKHSKDKYIHINNEWALQGNENCVMLYKKRITKKGSIQYDARGYFQDYPNALQKMIDMDIGPLNNIQYICEQIDILRKDITDMVQKLN